ncbi:MAG: hypothetical protein H6728_15525 [Myxococcales bacterium]|nr:hypothetical protein [Myxococcales bacterium]MCB9644482.1 hypothetical protein [Myxococcales bacterium]
MHRLLLVLCFFLGLALSPRDARAEFSAPSLSGWSSGQPQTSRWKATTPRFTLAYQHAIDLKQEPLATKQQAQTVPPGPTSPTPMPAFDQTYLYFTIGMLAGSLVVGVGEAITRQVGGDPLGWQIAGTLLNGAATVYNAVIMSQMLSQIQDPMIQMLFWVSLAASGIGFLVSVVQIIIQIHRRMSKPKEIPKPIAVMPWSDIDSQGNPRVGLALVGHF